jgi:nicotinate-nucleotide pyrophosphorylase (carboxylating)
MAAAAWSQRDDTSNLPELVVMLDNFGPERCKDIVSQLKEMGLRENLWLEASGGIVYEQLDDWHESGIDVLSTSAVNRGVSPLDLSMIVDGA